MHLLKDKKNEQIVTFRDSYNIIFIGSLNYSTVTTKKGEGQIIPVRDLYMCLIVAGLKLI